MINKVILVGNVGADPEVKYIKEDVAVAQFKLATSESYLSKDGQKVTQTEWHSIVAWRGLAKVIETYVKKGSQLYIEGKLTTRSYEKDGQTRYITEVVAQELKLLGKKSDSQGSYDKAPVRETAQVTEPIDDFTKAENDDLPF
ncbi:MAG: single-stranded DNA-binding protein [Bacteroidales bacterium]|nr:single-stranded DNA-binding protein [Bacteroidales bacterium]